MGQKLFIGGLPFSTSTEELRELFNQVDGVDNVTVVTDRDTGQSRGFGFAEMATSEAANEAIKKFNGYALGGRTLKVEVSKPSAPRGNGGGYRSGGGGGGGYRSGGNRW
jgi:RNA recognition motif-containing protein